jgi:branched-chain amino acid transport system substrate-binding protein
MNKNSKRVLGVVAAASLVLGAAATNAQAAKTITLVYQGPMTGDDGQTGTDEYMGVLTAIQIYKDSNPAVKVNIKSADDQGGPIGAQNVAPGIANDKSVVGIIGPAFSGASIASFPSYKPAGIPMISPSATNPSLTDPKSPKNGFPFFHRVLATDVLQSDKLVTLATRGVDSPKIYVVDDMSGYGNKTDGLGSLVDAVIAKRKLTVVGSSSIAKGTMAQSTGVATTIIGKGANVVIYSGYYSDAGALIKALRDAGYKGVFASGDGTLSGDFIPAAGKAAAEGARITAASLPFELAATPAQLAAFTKATGLKSPEGHTYLTEAFNATNIFLDCIKQGKTSRAGIQACIATGTFTGAAGAKIAFTRYGEIPGGAPIGDFVIKNSAIVYNGAVK